MTLESEPFSPFPNPWYEAFADLGPTFPCIDEPIIIEISKAIREKNNWQSNRKDPSIVAQWKSEARNITKNSNFDRLFDYAIQELEWYEKLPRLSPNFAKNQFKISAIDDKIVVNDTIFSAGFETAFAQQTTALLDSIKKGDSPVVDLVHPSLYPLQYGHTPVKLSNGLMSLALYSNRAPRFKKGVSLLLYKKNFQWLPTLFVKNGAKFEAKSYINNLHPKHSQLYASIESVFNTARPGLEMSLGRYLSPPVSRIKVPPGDDAYNEEWHKLSDTLEKKQRLKPLYSKDYTLEYEEYETTRFSFDDFESVKVIPKLTNIELTPDNPTFQGDSWTIQGTINEDIVATIIYFYDSVNIINPEVSFKCGFEEPFYEQGDKFYCEHYFGLTDGLSLSRVLGSLQCKKNRLVIFPNQIAQRFELFELEDKTKPGHLKMLSLFLVDPYNDLVTTTANVPPQQPEAEWQDLIDSKTRNSIKQLGINWPMSVERAEEIRQLLMEERCTKDSEDDDSAPPFARTFYINE